MFVSISTKGTSLYVSVSDDKKRIGSIIDNEYKVISSKGNALIVREVEDVFWYRVVKKLEGDGNLALDVINGQTIDLDVASRIVEPDEVMNMQGEDLIFLPSPYSQCKKCGKISYSKGEHSLLCDECAKDYGVCKVCGEVEEKDSINEDGACRACVRGATPCVDCGKLHYHEYREQDFKIINGNVMCISCYSKLPKCGCGKVANIGGNTKTDYGGLYMCSRCKDKAEDQPILGYGYKPTPQFMGSGDTELYFGVELEVNAKYETDSCLSDTADRLIALTKPTKDAFPFYLKRDSSIGVGFEIVTQPFNYQLFKKSLVFKRLFENINKLGARGGVKHKIERCGMHVHISRKAFKRSQLAKFTSFIYGNTEFLETVAERKATRYCTYNSVNTLSSAISSRKKGSHFSHTSAVNITDETVEVRIFNSTTVYEGFKKNIEFLKALFDFSLSYPIKKMSKSNFINYVKVRKSKYGNLNSFLQAFCGDLASKFTGITEEGSNRLLISKKEE